MTKEEKKELKKKLPPKWSIILAERTSFSISYVLRVMSGRASLVKIEEAALQLAQEYKERLQTVEELKSKIL